MGVDLGHQKSCQLAPTIISNHTTQHRMIMRCLVLVTILVTLVNSIPQPASDMEIYRECRDKFGTSPTIECSSPMDCSHAASNRKCPEHDCLPGRQGRSYCTWQVYEAQASFVLLFCFC